MADEAAEQAAPQPEEGATGAQPLPPLSVSGVVLSKAQLMDALRVYLPTITDFNPLPDGTHEPVLVDKSAVASQHTPQTAHDTICDTLSYVAKVP